MEDVIRQVVAEAKIVNFLQYETVQSVLIIYRCFQVLKSDIGEDQVHEVAKKMRLNTYETFLEEMKRKMGEEEPEQPALELQS